MTPSETTNDFNEQRLRIFMATSAEEPHDVLDYLSNLRLNDDEVNTPLTRSAQSNSVGFVTKDSS